MGDSCNVRKIAQLAVLASRSLSVSSEEERNNALAQMAASLRHNSDAIMIANASDVDNARKNNAKDSLIDRLLLNQARIEDMASALEALILLPDPLGKILEARTLYNGIELEKKSVPLGVVGIIYEARPNVAADAAGICIKSGNACVLRGSSLAARSNETIADILSQAVVDAGFPEGSIGVITTTDRTATDELLSLHDLIDVIIPRGGAGLISHCVETSKVPVIETGTGNCHVYVHDSADLDTALNIIINAKCRSSGSPLTFTW